MTSASKHSRSAFVATATIGTILASGALAAPPARPEIGLVASSDTGLSSTDRVTADATPTLSGRAPPRADVVVRAGSRVVARVKAGAGGRWTATAKRLADGAHTLVATARVDGKTGRPSKPLRITVDTTPPAAPTIALATVSDTLPPVGDGVIDERKPTLVGQALAGARVIVVRGSSQLAAVTAGGTGTWTATLPTQAFGRHPYQARAIDRAGNLSPLAAALVVRIIAVPGPSFILSRFTGTDGARFDGPVAGDRAGYSVDIVGDVNGDGRDDFAIGAPLADPDGVANAGSSYVVFGRAGGFSSPVNLAGLTATEGFRIDGDGGNSGLPIAAAGDVNGDGLDDLVVAAPNSDPGGVVDAGTVYVVYGRRTAFPPVVALASLNGVTGFRINGLAAGDGLGSLAVTGAGDVNGDGVGDLVLGAAFADPGALSTAGSAFVIFGRKAGFPATVSLAGLDGSTGFRFNGAAAGDLAGYRVAAAGDVNGDGIDDVMIGAVSTDPGGLAEAGSVFVVFGRTGGFASLVLPASLNGASGFRIDGPVASSVLGYGLAGRADVNADGIDDIAVGAPGTAVGGVLGVGAGFVVFGRQGVPFPAVLSLASLNGATGFRFDGVPATGSDSNTAVRLAAGDLNGDGIDDILVGASSADGGGLTDKGIVYVLFGKAGLSPALVSLADLVGTNGFRIDGVANYARAGLALASGGDVDGDGLDDLLIGAPNADPEGRDEAGSAYLGFGNFWAE